LRLTHPCRLSLYGGAASTGQLCVSEALAEHIAHSQFKARLTVLVLAVVIPECLFVYVAEEMKRLD
jgi:hypothetical protein